MIGGYIGGIRKKYLDPLSYLGIALTISGLFVLLLQKYFVDKIDFEMLEIFGTDADALQKNHGQPSISALLSLCFISQFSRLQVGCSSIKENIYFSEYMVVGVYTLAHFSIFSFPISLVLLTLFPKYYLVLSIPMFLVMVLYATYVANRLNGLDLFKSILFLMIFMIGFFGISIFLDLIFLVTGVLELKDFLPKGTP